MTVLTTRISCADTSWNPTVGCDSVSPGCDHCYARAIARRFFGGFTLRLHPERIADARRFRPVRRDGHVRPRLVFVNSMSDLWHRDVPDAFLDQVFDAIESNPNTVFQILTKRPKRMADYATRRWRQGVPGHVWLGVSVEDARYRNRVKYLRKLQEKLGPATTYVVFEPLLGPVDGVDLTTVDWVIIGGETGPGARPTDIDWVRRAVADARRVGAAIWFRQWGRWPHHPRWAEARGRTQRERRADLVARRLELLPDEQGGATVDGAVLRELPASYDRLRFLLSASAA